MLKRILKTCTSCGASFSCRITSKQELCRHCYQVKWMNQRYQSRKNDKAFMARQRERSQKYRDSTKGQLRKLKTKYHRCIVKAKVLLEKIRELEEKND